MRDRSFLLLLGFILPLLVGRALACRDLVERAPLRFHPHVGVTRQHGARVQAAIAITLPDQNAEIGPGPTSGGGFKPEPELDHLSNIVKAFNDQFGNIDWKDGDKIRKVIAEKIPAKVAADKAYQNAQKHSDRQNARIEHDKALGRVVTDLLADHTELFKQFSDNPSFKKWLADTIFTATYTSGAQAETPPSAPPIP